MMIYSLGISLYRIYRICILFHCKSTIFPNFRGAGYTPVRVIHRIRKHIPPILEDAGYTPVRVIHR